MTSGSPSVEVIGGALGRFNNRILSFGLLFLTLIVAYLYFGAIAPREALKQQRKLRFALHAGQRLHDKYEELSLILLQIGQPDSMSRIPYRRSIVRLRDLYLPSLEHMVKNDEDEQAQFARLRNAIYNLDYLQDRIGRTYFGVTPSAPPPGESVFVLESQRSSPALSPEPSGLQNRAILATESLEDLDRLDSVCRDLGELSLTAHYAIWTDALRATLNSQYTPDEAHQLSRDLGSTLLESVPAMDVLARYSPPTEPLSELRTRFLSASGAPFTVSQLSDLDRVEQHILRKRDETQAVLVPERWHFATLGVTLPRAYVLHALPLIAAALICLVADYCRRLRALLVTAQNQFLDDPDSRLVLMLAWRMGFECHLIRPAEQRNGALSHCFDGALSAILTLIGGLTITLPVLAAASVALSAAIGWVEGSFSQRALTLGAAAVMLVCGIAIVRDHIYLAKNQRAMLALIPRAKD